MKNFDKKNVKNRGFYALVAVVIFSSLGLAVSPEMVAAVAQIACEVSGCGE